MKADLQKEYNDRENWMAQEIARVRLREKTRFAQREAQLIDKQQAETERMRKEEERKAATALETQKFASQQQLAFQRQQALQQQALARQASERLQTNQAILDDSRNELSQLTAMAEEGQQKAKELEREKASIWFVHSPPALTRCSGASFKFFKRAYFETSFGITFFNCLKPGRLSSSWVQPMGQPAHRPNVIRPTSIRRLFQTPLSR